MSALYSAGRNIVGDAQDSAAQREEKDAQRFAARRERAEERRERLLDPRQRTMGLDLEALEKQRAEAEEKRRREKEAEMAEARENERILRQVAAFEAQQKAAKAAQARQVFETQKMQANLKTLSDTHDLQDPHALRKARPVTEEERQRMGPASLMNLAGEDLQEPERRLMQQEQMKVWVHEQMAEREAQKAREKMEDREYAAYLAKMGEYRDQIEAAEAERRAQEEAAIAAQNRLLAQRQAEEDARKREAERIADQRSLETLNKGLLHEDYNDAQSALGSHRVRPDHYRGRPQSQPRAVRQTLQEQIEERQRAKEAEKRAEEEEYRRNQELLRQARVYEYEIGQEKKKRAEEYRRQLELQRMQEQERREKEKAERQQLSIGDGFFGRFGSSDR